MLKGHQSWIFPSKPTILSTATVGGPFEAQGKIANDFDILHSDTWLEQDSFEKAEKMMLEEACDLAVKRASLQKGDINYLITGDLMNQITSSSFSARTIGVPYLGIFGACSTSMEGLALAAQLIDSRSANYVLTSTCSHNSTAEKQYRYPTEYGAQKPPSAQWTVTGAAAAVVAPQGTGPRVSSATIGKVVDMGLTDPQNMGAAMAPAAVDTIQAHFRDMQIGPDYYDLIATGDLGKLGHSIAGKLLKKHGFSIREEAFTDCGLLIYNDNQEVFSGGSGCACCATVTYGHLLNRLANGEWNRILVVATGALLSPLSFQQNETIPCIAHAVAIERGGNE
ncbi:stage V sporulation protein AD [Brevibacillus laterosporus]|uniref:SpoVAD n=2 Tax=Brevibacillus TaxID=55080 RepID=A0A0F6Y0S7_BRELA|nr:MULTISPECIES: stage V sporulation protein AD [Brevibacillus]AKF96046.1 SpoVAD [Brevibacillus laterosporus]MCR8984876.1 stage V sporulation protein AD [Brevibacillus laterosporus]MCZ0830604.1 stage V sporulation protein AD [Brevibacillus halotolerans]OAJ74193.1 stage V sporulation protein AD [Brevibacillus sp. SKDU10]GIN99525.1 stage V sporulation protein AD [Brevibacillus halotolerans]